MLQKGWLNVVVVYSERLWDLQPWLKIQWDLSWSDLGRGSSDGNTWMGTLRGLKESLGLSSQYLKRGFSI